MAEKVLENSICDTCGVDVRPQAMFCYNCGGAVSETVVEETVVERSVNGKTEVSDAWLRDNFSEEKDVEKIAETEDVSEELAEENIEEVQEVSASSSIEREADLNDKKAGIQENAKLKSAAAMRRKAKSFQAKQVEVVWEEPQNSSTTKLLLVVLLLTLFAVSVVGFALYLK